MKKNHRFYQLILEFCLCLIPYSGLAYFLVVFVALFSACLGIGASDVARNVLLYVGRIYWFFSFFTMFYVLSYSYLESCAYFDSFCKFFRKNYKEFAFGFFMSLVWPIFWLKVDVYLRRYHRNWADIVYEVSSYWILKIHKRFKRILF